MKNEKYRFGYNTVLDRQYSIYASKNEKPYKTQLETEYDLMFFFETPTRERYGIDGGFNLGTEDFANIARAVLTLSGELDRVDPYVRRKYLSGYFPNLVKAFVDKVKELFTAKETQERQEREAREAERRAKRQSKKSRDDWSR